MKYTLIIELPDSATRGELADLLEADARELNLDRSNTFTNYFRDAAFTEGKVRNANREKVGTWKLEPDPIAVPQKFGAVVRGIAGQLFVRAEIDGVAATSPWLYKSGPRGFSSWRHDDLIRSILREGGTVIFDGVE